MSTILRCALGLLLPLAACDETAKACHDDTSLPLKQRISACGELCDKDDGKACVKQGELADPACFEKGDKETCRWMCDYAKHKELYCKKHAELGG